MAGQVLLCNSEMQLITRTTWQRALALVMSEPPRADVVESSDRIVKTAGGEEVVVPSVIRLRQGDEFEFELSVDPGRIPPKHFIHMRDNWRCAYCYRKSSTVDHIYPQSRGGPNSWMNLVSCCRPCNGKKDDRTPLEAGMELLYEPRVPSVEELRMYINGVSVKDLDRLRLLADESPPPLPALKGA